MTAWLLSMIGTALFVVGFVLAAVEFTTSESLPLDVRLGTPVAVTGGVLLLAGLAAAAYRSIVLRRDLGEDRYRGPSILILLAIVIAAGTLATLPFIGALVAAMEQQRELSQVETLVVLVSTSASLLLTAAVFVLLPRALPGVRLLPSGVIEGARQIVLGVLIAGPAWIVANIVTVLVTALLGALFGGPPDTQVIEELFPVLDPLAAVLVIVIAAPISEEIFFRGVVFNAWEREYGFRRALIGSSIVFALIHGSLYAFLPILLLAFVLGYVYARTRSLLTVVVIHATFNGISVGILFLSM